jgi:hypothetical protein
MSFTTPNDLITLAFKDSGVFGIGQTPNAEDTNDAFNRVNMMLAQWQRKRWLIWHLVDTSLVSTGATSYSVGTGGDFNIPRPDKIESAFFRQINITPLAPDYPLEIIQAREDYNRITLKGLTAFPQYVFYDSGYPTGTLYPWPLPQANIYELHITTKAVLSQFTSLSQTIDLPPEYFAAIFYNLCARLRPAYGLAPDPTIVALARDALNVIRMANAQIPRLQMPDGLVTRGVYDIYSDSQY